MATDDWMETIVRSVTVETPLIRSIALEKKDGSPLPDWEPGSHVKVRLLDGDTRSYSLVNFAPVKGAVRQPSSYLLGIRLEDPSQGGSKFMHALKPGDALFVSKPTNNFRLEATPNRPVLLAGGIGITPIASMISQLLAEDRPFQAVYAGRSEDQLAFRGPLRQLAGDRLAFHYDDKAGPFDLAALMSSLVADEPLYLCGPKAMIDAAVALAHTLNWPQNRLRFEIFAAAQPQQGDAAFDVVLASSGRTFTIPPDKTILDVLIEAGVDPMYDCKRGDCVICQVNVIDGIPDHRDYILSESERAEGKLIQICVSRAKTPSLTLDL